MTPAWSWLIIFVGVQVALACAWIASRRIIGAPPDPDLGTVMSWPEDQRRAWMRHPMHTRRCCCRLYGLPFPETVVLDDSPDPVLHDTDRCIPYREVTR